MSSATLHATRQIPDLTIDSQHYVNFYFRGDNNYNTNVLSLGNFAYYWLMNILGHIYVCSVNLNMTRSPFRSPHNTIRDFYLTIWIAPIFYVFGAAIQLRAQNDLNQTPCDVDTLICAGQPYTWQECFNYNQFFWFPAYLFGL